MDVKRKRNSNFTTREVDVLVTEVERRKDVLFGKLSSSVTGEVKRKAWGEVTTSVNEVGSGEVRKEAEVKKKWSDVASQSKKKEAKRRMEMQATGGGSVAVDDVKLTATELKVIGILGEQSIVGIVGGVDVGMQSVFTTVSLTDVSIFAEGSQADTECVQKVEQPATNSTGSSGKARKRSAKEEGECSCSTAKLIDLEFKRLKIEEERLEIEKKRLEIEQERLEWERKRWNLKMARDGLTVISGKL
jgi:Myb/SANT-like DNA-binding domain